MTEKTNEPTSMADEVAKRVLEALEPRLDQIDERFDKLEAKLDTHTGELEGIRTVVDTLPSYEMVESIETAQNRMVEDLAAARSSQQKATTFQRQTVSRLDRLESGQEKIVKGLDRAGIAVR